MACIVRTNVSSADEQLLIAVMQWIAASVAPVSRLELCLHDSTQLAQVCRPASVCLSVIIIVEPPSCRTNSRAGPKNPCIVL